jgi:hypothetical protein
MTLSNIFRWKPHFKSMKCDWYCQTRNTALRYLLKHWIVYTHIFLVTSPARIYVVVHNPMHDNAIQHDARYVQCKNTNYKNWNYNLRFHFVNIYHIMLQETNIWRDDYYHLFYKTFYSRLVAWKIKRKQIYWISSLFYKSLNLKYWLYGVWSVGREYLGIHKQEDKLLRTENEKHHT